VNSGGEPERDEYGLPPVDIEIPDDARELDRDVQAYYRELRAERRRQRRQRLHLSLARDGIVLPLLACCLILALITGTLLTVFTATSGLTPQPGTSKPAGQHQGASRAPSSPNSPGRRTSPGTGGRSSRTSSPAPSTVPAKQGASSGAAALTPGPVVEEVSASVPAGSLAIAGENIPLQSLSGSMLIILPSNCRCATTVNWLAGVGASVNALVFLVSTPGMPGTSAEANHYEAQLNSSALQGTVTMATDAQGVLYASFPPAYQLTVVLIGTHSNAVYYANRLSPGESPALLIHALKS
jgi:hypothetical protein